MKKNVIILIILFSNLFNSSFGIWLSVPSSGTKCVSEEMHPNIVVLSDYYVVSDEHTSQDPTISVKVTSPYGKSLHENENVTHGQFAFTTHEAGNYLVTSPYGKSLHENENVTHGQFAFTTHEAGNYLVCLWLDGYNPKGGEVSVNLDWRTGIAAKDWELVASKEKIEGVELELRKLEGAVEAIHENLIYLKTKEAEMRTMSEKTNARVTVCSIMSLVVCITASGLQLSYLKRYFRKKKLL